MLYFIQISRREWYFTEHLHITGVRTVIRFRATESHWIKQPSEPLRAVAAIQLDGCYRHLHRGNSYFMEKGSIMLFSESESYEVYEHSRGTSIAVHFDTDRQVEPRFAVLGSDRMPQIKNDFLQLYKAYSRNDACSWYECSAALYSILGRILRASDSGAVKQRYANIVRARDFLAENYGDRLLSLSDIAAQAGIGERHFSELFRLVYSDTPMHYLTRIRLSAAEDMLLTRRYTVEQISKAIGYANPGYFCRVFVRENGMPPSCWRSRNQ